MSNERKEKFTPGPWGFYLSQNTGLPPDPTECIVINQVGLPIPSKQPAVCIVTDKDSMNDRDRANARLIAAAPDMYAVLTELEESVDYWSEYDVPIGIIDQIRAALAKARG